MKFKYSKWKCPRSEAFPQRISALRPVIHITIKYQNQRLRVFALLDTGADYCLFPKWMGEKLGIPIQKGKKLEYKGAAGGIRNAYFHDVVLEIGGWKNKCYVGFTYEPKEEERHFGILGTIGFFDKYEVIYNFKKNEIKVKELT